MNAADVLNHLRNADAVAQVAALLAHGERGVAILPDGTLWALEWRAHEGEDGEIADPTRLTVSDMGTGKVANPYWSTLYRLVPPLG